VPSLWSTFDVSIYGAADTTTYSYRPIVWIPLYPCKSTEILAKKFEKYIHYHSVQIALTFCSGHWRSLQILWRILERETATHNNLLPENLQRPVVLLDNLVSEYPWNNYSTITWSVVKKALYKTLFNTKVHPQSKVLNTTVRILTSIIIITQLYHHYHHARRYHHHRHYYRTV
jgi:hypothetical protein